MDEPISPEPPALLVVVGASGAGKTTLVGLLAALELPGVGCYQFDSIGIPVPEEMMERFGSGEAFQAWALGEWMMRLMRNEDGVALAVLDAQVRPSAVRDAFARHGLTLASTGTRAGHVFSPDADPEPQRRRGRRCRSRLPRLSRHGYNRDGHWTR